MSTNTNTMVNKAIDAFDELNSVALDELNKILHDNMLENSTASYEIVDNVKIDNLTVKITPKLAEYLLNKNNGNRPVNQANIDKMVKDMLSNQWKYDGSPISFDKYGRLLNGQHRLKAIIKSGKTFPFKVNTGHQPEIFATMDIGKIRTGSDVLAIAGYDNHTMYAQTANFMFKFLRGSITQNDAKSSRHASRPTNGLSHTELLKFVELKPFIKDSVAFALKMKKKQPTSLMPNFMISGLYFLFNEKDSVKAESFMSKLLIGEGLESNSPIFCLRNRLVNSKFDKTKRLQYNEVVKLIVLAWNYYRMDKKIKVMKIPEALPAIM